MQPVYYAILAECELGKRLDEVLAGRSVVNKFGVTNKRCIANIIAVVFARGEPQSKQRLPGIRR